MNFNKFGRKVLLGLVSLVVVLSCVELGVRAEGETGILYLNNEPIASFRQDGNYTYPTKSGYVFGGWYNDAEGKDPMTEEEANNATTAYAKWVPDYVLSVKAQVNQAALDDNITTTSKAAIRLLTSVDSRDYKSVGFDVVRGDYPSYTYHLDSKNVYTRVRVVGETEGTYTEHTPEDVFGSDSHFFEAVTFKNMPENAVNTELKATPYWITLDGTRVEGTKSIKTVNLGRSWVYVNASPNAEDSLQFGTRNHPFTKFDDALDAVLLTNNGKVIIQENSDIETASDFTWEKAEKTRNITIVGENQETSKLNFSAISKLSINDGVIFDNMTLTLPTTVFANGHGFTIKDNVVSENAKTSIYGGSEGTSTKGATVTETNVEVYAGSYKEVWGGGKYCTITNDIHVTIKNANIYDSTGGDRSRVFGSGANDTVKGDIFVTIGGTFNATQKVAEFERSDHSRYSSVHGAGSGTVQGNTYVRIEDQAEVDYVYGGGGSSSEVKGTCHVELKGGTVFSIYGGGKGDNSTSAGKNADTSVVVTGGKVCQIIGGNGNSMTGNSYVEIAGGQVTRRIHGGCYNDVSVTNAHHVTGYSTVVIKDKTSVANLSGLDSGITAGSRSTTEYSDEIAVLICNDDSYADLEDEIITSYNEYDYLIQANAGGLVSSIGTRLSITPDGANNAIVRLDNSTSGILHAYMTSKGLSILPELSTETGKREMFVAFGTEPLGADELSDYEAKVGGTHFDTLENAIAEAKELSDAGEAEDGKVTVTLLKDVEIDSVLSVGGAYNILLQSEANNKYSITTSYTDDNVITVYGTLTINNVDIKGGKHGIYVGNSGKLYSVEAENLQGVSISNTALKGLYVDGGIVDIYNLTVSETGEQAVQFQNKAKATISNYNVIGTSSSVAVRIMTGADVTLNDGTINANTTYGIYMDGTASKVTATDTKVIRGANNTTNPLVGVASATSQFAFDETEGGEAYIDGQSYGGRGVEVAGTFVLNGGTIRNNSATSGAGVTVQKDATFIMNGGTISNNTATEYGAGVYALGSFTMNGGEISDNTAKKGGGVYVAASSTFTMQSGTISGNTATNAGTSNATKDSGGGVYVAADGTFNMNAPIEGVAAGIIKENIAKTNQFGAGVLVKGTFNMNAGTISNHGSENNPLEVEGTGVCLVGTSATLTMNGGEIKNNYSTKAGVGVSMRDGNKTAPVFTMNGGAITANHASGKDSNVGGIVVRYGVFEMNEGAVISNNTAMKLAGGMSLEGSANTTFIFNGGVFENNTAGTYGHDIYLAGVITLNKTLASDVSISPKSYSETKVIAQKGDGISDEEFKTSMKLLDIEDNIDGHWFVNDEGILKKGPVLLQSTGKGYATLSEALEVAAEGDTITILENAEIANTIAITKNLKFTSTTAVSIVANDTMTGDIFSVAEEKTLEIVGASEDAMISITGNAKTVNNINNSGTTNLTNVKVFNGQMGIYISKGSVVASNIEIHNTSKRGVNVQAGASVEATGIVVQNTGQQGLYFTGKSGQMASANISNFEISGTKAAAVRPMSYCNVTLSNGTVTAPNIEGLAMGNNNTYQITDMKVYTSQDRITNKNVLWYNGAHVDNDYYTGVTVLPIE